jgi:hypothetical protein
LTLLLLVSGATALTLTLGLVPEQQVLNAAVSAIGFNVMYELLLSRQQQQCALVPLVDLANHVSAIENEVLYSYFQDGFVAVAGATFRKGEQVFISYGKQTTDSLLQCYGFVEKGNAHDVYTFLDTGPVLVAAGVVDSERVAALAQEEGKPSQLLHVVMTSTAQLPAEVMAALRFVAGAAASVEAGAEKVSNEKDVVVWRAVAALVSTERSTLGGPVAEDKRALREAEREGRERRALVLQYLVIKKEFLEARSAQLQTRIKRLSAGG